ncbi:MAG: hypothetical protein ACREQ2_22170 [Candidatus Binatia bacterium]
MAAEVTITDRAAEKIRGAVDAHGLRVEGVEGGSQLELIGTESDDRLDKKICPWDAIKMYEFDEEAKLSKSFYEPTKIDAVNGVYIMDAAEKQRLEEKQIELYAGGGMNDVCLWMRPPYAFSLTFWRF